MIPCRRLHRARGTTCLLTNGSSWPTRIPRAVGWELLEGRRMRIAQVLTGVVCLAALGAAPARAQQRASGGAQIGGSMSRITPAVTDQSVSMRPGLLVGVYGVVPFLSTVSIQTELVYAQKYSRLAQTIGSTVQTADLRLEYVEIPLLAKLALFRGSYILEGVSIGFPIRAKLKSASGGDEDIKNQTTSPDVGIVIGGGVPIQRIAIEGRYDGGLRKIDKTAGAAVQRNRSFSILARVHF